MNKDELAKAERIIALNDKFKGAYFFTPPSSASERRRYEAKNSDCLEFDHEGVHYKFQFQVECSCKNVYVRRNYTKGDKATNIKTLKTIVAKQVKE